MQIFKQIKISVRFNSVVKNNNISFSPVIA